MSDNGLPIKGKTCTDVKRTTFDGEDAIEFTVDDGTMYRMHHNQDCCEDVRIEDICGDLDDLVGVPLTMAEASSTDQSDEYDDRSMTWTFYRFAGKGHVTIRWVGESNGYYSEEVDFERV